MRYQVISGGVYWLLMSLHFKEYKFVAKLTIKRYEGNLVELVETPAAVNLKQEDYIGKPLTDADGKQIGEIIDAEIVRNG